MRYDKIREYSPSLINIVSKFITIFNKMNKLTRLEEDNIKYNFFIDVIIASVS